MIVYAFFLTGKDVKPFSFFLFLGEFLVLLSIKSEMMVELKIKIELVNTLLCPTTDIRRSFLKTQGIFFFLFIQNEMSTKP